MRSSSCINIMSDNGGCDIVIDISKAESLLDYHLKCSFQIKLRRWATYMKIANRNIFIDFDGTLVDIAPRHYRVYKECVEKMGGTPLDRKKYWELKRDNISWNELLPMSGLEVNNRDDYFKLFIDRIESLEELYRDELFVDSLSTLKKLFSNDNKLYLLSLRRNSDALDKQIEKLGIGCFFEKILSGHSDTKEGTLLKKGRYN